MVTEEIKMYTVADIQAIFRCSRSQAYRLVNAGGFPAMKIGTKILSEKNAVEKWIRQNAGKTIWL